MKILNTFVFAVLFGVSLPFAEANFDTEPSSPGPMGLSLRTDFHRIVPIPGLQWITAAFAPIDTFRSHRLAYTALAKKKFGAGATDLPLFARIYSSSESDSRRY